MKLTRSSFLALCLRDDDDDDLQNPYKYCTLCVARAPPSKSINWRPSPLTLGHKVHSEKKKLTKNLLALRVRSFAQSLTMTGNGFNSLNSNRPESSSRQAQRTFYLSSSSEGSHFYLDFIKLIFYLIRTFLVFMPSRFIVCGHYSFVFSWEQYVSRQAMLFVCCGI